MTLFALSYLAGVLTILAPCILPVIPFVFARVDQPFVRSGLPLLAGLALSFAVVATLATVGGAWAAEANQWGRYAALAVLAACGLALLVPRLAERWTRPLVALGASLGSTSRGGRRSAGSSFVLGAATGLLWAPCAGPILGLVLATAALNGASVDTSLLLLAYAAGAASSLGAALWAGGRVFALMKRSLGAGEWLRRGLGAAVLAGVAAVAFGIDTRLLAKLPPIGGDAIEQSLLERFNSPPPAAARLPSGGRDVNQPVSGTAAVELPPAAMHPVAMLAAAEPEPTAALPVEGTLPEFSGGTGWLNSAPLTAQGLRGKVVLVDIWTFGCINCQRAIPYVRGWADKYKSQGLVTIGVHAPEFAFERKADNVKRAAADLKLTFPIVLDNDFAIWRAFSNQYWPALYLVDAQGRIRYTTSARALTSGRKRSSGSCSTKRAPAPRAADEHPARPTAAVRAAAAVGVSRQRRRLIGGRLRGHQALHLAADQEHAKRAGAVEARRSAAGTLGHMPHEAIAPLIACARRRFSE